VHASKSFRFHPAALDEFRAADDWYAARSPDASAEFLLAISDALQNICSSPRRWAVYLYGTRRFILHHFPFSIVYLDEQDVVKVVAVAHAKRRPGYWRRRL
jgi:plasmid stabilization system protein ParE